MRWAKWSFATIGILALLAVTGSWLMRPMPPDHPPLLSLMDFEGVKATFRRQSDMKMSPNAAIIGFHVEGQPYAFVKAAMEPIKGHVVNMHTGDTAVSVTYCDMFRCVRVMKEDDTSEPIELGVGGLAPRTLVLKYDGKTYSQKSEKLPFDDLEYEQTTWSDWMARFPNSLVYDGKKLEAPPGGEGDAFHKPVPPQPALRSNR